MYFIIHAISFPTAYIEKVREAGLKRQQCDVDKILQVKINRQEHLSQDYYSGQYS